MNQAVKIQRIRIPLETLRTRSTRICDNLQMVVDAVENDHHSIVSYGIRRCEFDAFLLDRVNAPKQLATPVKSIVRNNGNWVINEHGWGEYFSLSCAAKDEDVFAWEVRENARVMPRRQARAFSPRVSLGSANSSELAATTGLAVAGGSFGSSSSS